jgi:hypothetical protein
MCRAAVRDAFNAPGRAHLATVQFVTWHVLPRSSRRTAWPTRISSALCRAVLVMASGRGREKKPGVARGPVVCFLMSGTLVASVRMVEPQSTIVPAALSA